MFLPCNLNMSFNPLWITSNCVKIVQNLVEVKKCIKKCIHVLKHLLQINGFGRSKNKLIKIKYKPIKQLLLVTKLGRTAVNITSEQAITCSK